VKGGVAARRGKKQAAGRFTPEMRAAAVWLVLLAVASCGTPSRHLSTRTVDDPMTLPRRMIALGVSGEVSQRPRPQTVWNVFPTLSYGITDRLQYDGLFALRWAILDDAPPPAEVDRRPDHLSLSVRGGATGLGASSLEGFIMLPVVAAQVRKHLGARHLVAVTATWQGRWVESPTGGLDGYTETLETTRSRQSTVDVDASALRQLGDHVALTVGAGAHQLQGCTAPNCTWVARGGEVWLGTNIRPRRWLDLDLRVFAGGRYRPAGQPPQPPDEPFATAPGAVSWLGTRATLLLLW
jgi:hypothetical protein